MQVVKHTHRQHSDARGHLVAIEGVRDVPFEIKRVYFIYGVNEGVRRGCHAHRSLEQLFVCVHGSCRVTLDDGRESREVLLNDPCESIYVGPGIWREIDDFSLDAVLMVLASDYYDEDDFIRDYGEFLEEANSGKAHG